jgi:FKBP-type peptidyl-prolyl cis-trans isomerase SlyD
MTETQIKVAKDCVVAMHYVLRDAGGAVLDQSEQGEPLLYLHGHQNIVPGLEKALSGASVGDTRKVVVSPEEGYGVHEERLVFTVPRDQLPEDLSLEVGAVLGLQSPQGQTMSVRVMEVVPEYIKLDANHELAGMTLHFEVTIASVRAASEEELTHGHVHGPSGHLH